VVVVVVHVVVAVHAVPGHRARVGTNESKRVERERSPTIMNIFFSSSDD
jgi:hypothetical protein